MQWLWGNSENSSAKIHTGCEVFTEDTGGQTQEINLEQANTPGQRVGNNPKNNKQSYVQNRRNKQ